MHCHSGRTKITVLTCVQGQRLSDAPAIHVLRVVEPAHSYHFCHIVDRARRWLRAGALYDTASIWLKLYSRPTRDKTGNHTWCRRYLSPTRIDWGQSGTRPHIDWAESLRTRGILSRLV